LQEYFDRASHHCLSRGVGHEPHLLDRVFRMQQNLAANGTMKIDSWD
jgi:acetyl-CoA hydrolase